MALMSLDGGIMAHGRNLLSDRRGNVAVIFAGAAIPLLVGLGVAVDYGRAVVTRSRLADAVDSAVLAIGSQPAMSDADAKTAITKWVDAQVKGAAIGSWQVDSVTQTGGAIHVTASGSVPTTLAGLVGVKTLPVAVSTEAVRQAKKIELALVLDNTGSMAGTKLSSLITAANSLVDTLAKGTKQADDLRVALVPFSMTVKVGASYKTATWMDTLALSPVHSEIFDKTGVNRFSLFDKMGVAWGGCVESRPMPYDVQDTLPSASNPSTYYVPYFAPDEPDTKSGNSAVYPNSYLADVTTSTNWKTQETYSAKYTKNFTKTGTNNSTGYTYGPNSGCGLAPLMRLTNNTTSIKSAISAMTAVGDTNIPIGLAWGWNTLAPAGPFGDGVAYTDTEHSKIVVLMTDGQNQNSNPGGSNSNASYYSSIGYIWQNRLGITSGSDTTRRTAMDSRLSALCTNMKAKGIQIYTVRVEVTTGSSTVLKNCASSPDMFYDVQDSSQLLATFQSIAGEISKLRLSK